MGRLFYYRLVVGCGTHLVPLQRTRKIGDAVAEAEAWLRDNPEAWGAARLYRRAEDKQECFWELMETLRA